MKSVISIFAGLLLVNQAFAWTTYQGNISHNGYVPVEMDPSNFSLRWTRTVGAGLNPVTIGDGRVYTSTTGYFNNQHMFILSDADGSQLCTYAFGDVYSVNPPAYFDNKVYIQSGNHSSDTYLNVFSADNCQLAFRSAHAAQWERYYAPTIDNGVVYVNGGSYGGMYAFNAQNGLQLWFASLAQYDQWTPSLDANYAYSYTGGVLRKNERATGALVSSITDTNFSWNGYAVNQAVALGGANDGFIINGNRLVRFDFATNSIAYEVSANYQYQASVANGVVYGISSNSLAARDQMTGTLLWSWIPATQETLKGAFIVTNTHVIISGLNNIYAVNLQTHATDWSYNVSGQLALADSVLYVANNTTGELATFNMGPPPDADNDGISDGNDNCPGVANPDQTDTDQDGVGDACNDAIDSDGDEYNNTIDNCPTVYNPDQANQDNDSFGDACDPYPQIADNLGYCLAQNQNKDALISELTAQVTLLTSENQTLNERLKDSDNDGMIDQYDTCPNSSGSIDQTGCTVTQYCATFTSKSECYDADWKNDEGRYPRDCRWENNSCTAR